MRIQQRAVIARAPSKGIHEAIFLFEQPAWGKSEEVESAGDRPSKDFQELDHLVTRSLDH